MTSYLSTTPQINRLRDKIQILKKEQQRSSSGHVVYQYVPDSSTWAEVIPYSAALSNGTFEVLNQVLYKVTVRYREDLHAKDKILYRNKILQIQNEPVPLEGRKRFMIFTAQEFVEDKTANGKKN